MPVVFVAPIVIAAAATTGLVGASAGAIALADNEGNEAVGHVGLRWRCLASKLTLGLISGSMRHAAWCVRSAPRAERVRVARPAPGCTRRDGVDDGCSDGLWAAQARRALGDTAGNYGARRSVAAVRVFVRVDVCVGGGVCPYVCHIHVRCCLAN